MKIIDLSHTLENGMPFFPGTKEPRFEIFSTVEKDGYKETELKMLTHTGTHIDCPAHMLDNTFTTDTADLNLFYANSYVLDFSHKKQGEIIDVNAIKKYEKNLVNKQIVLIHTGWDRFWGTEKYFASYPYLSQNAVKYLIDFGIKGIGLDVISIDAIDAEKFVNHYEILGKGGIIIENLRNLNELIGKEFIFSALPLKIKEGDGSPVRAIAILEK